MLIHDQEKSEDVAQEAVTRLLQYRDTFVGDFEKLCALGFTIAKNIIRDKWNKGRKDGRRIVILESDMTNAGTPEDDHEPYNADLSELHSFPPNQEHRVELIQTLARLNKLSKQRQEIVLGFALGDNEEEIGARMGMRPNTVRTNGFRARRILAGLTPETKKKINTRACMTCGNEFEIEINSGRFCSDECRPKGGRPKKSETIEITLDNGKNSETFSLPRKKFQRVRNHPVHLSLFFKRNVGSRFDIGDSLTWTINE